MKIAIVGEIDKNFLSLFIKQIAEELRKIEAKPVLREFPVKKEHQLRITKKELLNFCPELIFACGAYLSELKMAYAFFDYYASNAQKSAAKIIFLEPNDNFVGSLHKLHPSPVLYFADGQKLPLNAVELDTVEQKQQLKNFKQQVKDLFTSSLLQKLKIFFNIAPSSQQVLNELECELGLITRSGRYFRDAIKIELRYFSIERLFIEETHSEATINEFIYSLFAERRHSFYCSAIERRQNELNEPSGTPRLFFLRQDQPSEMLFQKVCFEIGWAKIQPLVATELDDNIRFILTLEPSERENYFSLNDIFQDIVERLEGIPWEECSKKTVSLTLSLKKDANLEQLFEKVLYKESERKSIEERIRHLESHDKLKAMEESVTKETLAKIDQFSQLLEKCLPSSAESKNFKNISSLLILSYEKDFMQESRWQYKNIERQIALNLEIYDDYHAFIPFCFEKYKKFLINGLAIIPEPCLKKISLKIKEHQKKLQKNLDETYVRNEQIQLENQEFQKNEKERILVISSYVAQSFYLSLEAKKEILIERYYAWQRKKEKQLFDLARVTSVGVFCGNHDIFKALENHLKHLNINLVIERHIQHWQLKTELPKMEYLEFSRKYENEHEYKIAIQEKLSKLNALNLSHYFHLMITNAIKTPADFILVCEDIDLLLRFHSALRKKLKTRALLIICYGKITVAKLDKMGSLFQRIIVMEGGFDTKSNTLYHDLAQILRVN